MAKKVEKDSDRLLAALSYVWVLFIIPFVLGHNKPFVYRHAKQGMALFIFELILAIVSWIPILGWIIGLIGWFAVVIVAIVGIAHALSGKDYEIPVIGKMMK